MGILANSASICVFQLQGVVPGEDLSGWAAERLAKNRFRPIELSADEISAGWVHLDDFRLNSFDSPATFQRDHYLAFSLRCDRRRVPAALLKTHLRKAEEDFLTANPGFQKVPKRKREELAEAVRNALLSRSLPIPAVYDAVWDTRSGKILFASLGTKAIELFETLFKQTFEGARLIPVHPFSRAREVIDPRLLPALERANRASSDAVVDQIRGNSWLGTDFLNWLMYRSMNQGQHFLVSRGGPTGAGESFVAFVDERLILQGEGEFGRQKITVTGPQDHFGEVITALRHGKQISEAVLFLEKDANSWKMSLKGESFNFASLRTPPVKLEKDDTLEPEIERQALFFEKIFLLEGCFQLFDSLYAAFLEERLGREWEEKAAAIRQWIGQD
jgi:hypothetical protein